METSTKDALVIWAGTIAGGAGGWWGVGRLGAAYGWKLGPWGALAGALAGAVLGATVTKRMLGTAEGAAPAELGEA